MKVTWDLTLRYSTRNLPCPYQLFCYLYKFGLGLANLYNGKSTGLIFSLKNFVVNRLHHSLIGVANSYDMHD